ncbi:MAG TPA: AAA family ATPase [candidate division Zixibacteria bacterium]|nr:AAA family ATPase [candidate division Zixibacteria bacterium]
MYLEYFGFRERPFSVTPDPGFYYENEIYREAFAGLRYGVEQGKGIVVLVGEVGTGKTMLLRRLMGALAEDVDVACVSGVSGQVGFHELLREIGGELGLGNMGEGWRAAWGCLREYLASRARRGRRVALLIDEAQELSEEALEGLCLLSNLETEKEKLLQMVLAGQPELEERLAGADMRQLRQRVALWLRLKSLGEAEVDSYIGMRLRRAGCGREALFDRGAVRAVWKYSRGVPRLINLLCDQALVTGYATTRQRVSRAMVEEAAVDLRLLPGAKKAAPADTQPSPTSLLSVEAGEGRREFPEFEATVAGRRRRGDRAALWSGTAAAVATAVAGAMLYPSFDSALSDLSRRLAQARVDRDAPLSVPPGASTLREAEHQAPVPAQREIPTESLSDSAAVAAPKDSTAERGAPARPFPADDKNDGSASAEDLARRAIANRAIEGVRVSVKDGIARLEGRVATERQKQAALRAVRAVPAVTSVIDRVAVESAPRVDLERGDERLEFEILKAIHARAVRGVEVSVTGSTAYLSGRVASDSQRAAAVSAAHGVSGIRKVHDRIAVGTERSALDVEPAR